MESRYTALLQMYGEKEEMMQELVMDLEDVKDMYRHQVGRHHCHLLFYVLICHRFALKYIFYSNPTSVSASMERSRGQQTGAFSWLSPEDRAILARSYPNLCTWMAVSSMFHTQELLWPEITTPVFVLSDYQPSPPSQPP